MAFLHSDLGLPVRYCIR